MRLMSRITISKTEYSKLRKESKAYQDLMVGLFEQIIKNPIENIVDDFRASNIYSKKFITDLESGLRKIT
jgi:predicted transcriptional regulator